jgi:hypothetical protein
LDPGVSFNPAELNFPLYFAHLSQFHSYFFNEECVNVAIFKRVHCHPAVSGYGGCLKIASCSTWLLVHLLFDLYFRLLMRLPDLNMAMPAPTPCSDLLPSVNIWIVLVSLLSFVRKVIVSVG